MTRYPFVAFDFDGTLADSLEWIRQNYGAIATRHRLRPMSREDLERLRDLPTRESLKMLGVRAWQIPFLARDIRRRVLHDAAHIDLYPGIADFLDELARSGRTLAVVTSNGEEVVRAVLGPSAERIATFICGVSLFGKARRLARLREGAGLAPGEMLYVGDQVVDIEAARKAGLASAAVAWGIATPAVLSQAQPTHLCPALPDLRALLVP